jgi:hypothetical protein
MQKGEISIIGLAFSLFPVRLLATAVMIETAGLKDRLQGRIGDFLSMVYHLHGHKTTSSTT